VRIVNSRRSRAIGFLIATTTTVVRLVVALIDLLGRHRE
jgi:hypothetical protein